ncbi:BatD family protein [Dysgonomonas sp. ZJ709]|uniref:BatD family protein n=1 Tax=Dysgonomonas sp. ZJ709 TaxID=2709797 RepID=UPI0013EAFCF8|nr:BatD family protein [Dysgonomonas sp. ZJ709]
MVHTGDIRRSCFLAILLLQCFALSFAQQKQERKQQKKSAVEIDAFIKTVVSKSSVHLSDTLTITYRLYTTVDINRVVEVDFPYIRDFYTANMTPSRQKVEEEKINNIKYRVIDLRTLVLQPRSIGEKTIPEGEITLEYAIPTGRKMRNAWGEIYDESERKLETLTIDPVIINVHDMIAL